MTSVPESKHDDQADSVAGAFEEVVFGRKKARLATVREVR
jgi:phage terminase large subunit-like protein